MRIRRTNERGRTQHNWLESAHSFSFGGYADPEWRGWSALRVLNDDTVAPGGGFATHEHTDMEIVTYVLDGVISHRDSTGAETRLSAGEMQRMSAGTGITHSEFNGSATEALRFLQIWVYPQENGVIPAYEQTWIDPEVLKGTLRAVVTPDGRGRTLSIGQDVTIYATRLMAGRVAAHTIAEDRVGYLHLISGMIRLAGKVLSGGDGACLPEGGVRLEAVHDTHLILLDLP